MIRFAPDKINKILACVDLFNVANKHQLGTCKRQKTRNAQRLSRMAGKNPHKNKTTPWKIPRQIFGDI